MREDWIEVELGEACEINLGQSPPSSTYNTEKEGLPFFQGKAEFTDLYPVVEKWCNSPKKIAEVDDILLSVRAPVGATNIANQKCAIGRGLAAIRYEPCYKYILYYLKLIERILDDQGTGTTFKAISGSVLRSQKLPLAPLPEQRAIAAKIEQLFSELDNGIANLKTAKSKLEINRQAILKQAFEGELTKEWRENNKYGLDSISSVISKVSEHRRKKHEESCKLSKENGLRAFKPQNLVPKIREYHIKLPNEWIWLSMSDISSTDQHSMSSGPFGSCLGTKDYQESGIPVIRGKNIQKGKFVCDDFVFISEEKALSLTRSLAYSGDIIVVAVGSSGEAALVPKELKKSVISQNCNKFTLDESFVDSKFVLFCLQNQIVKSQMTEKTTDTVRTFLSLTSLKSMLIPIPPLIEQKQIVEQIEMKFSVCEKLNESIDQSLEKAQALRQSILKKAFKGKLLNEDELQNCRQQPDWEPAAKLLERVKKDSKTKKS